MVSERRGIGGIGGSKVFSARGIKGVQVTCGELRRVWRGIREGFEE